MGVKTALVSPLASHARKPPAQRLVSLWAPSHAPCFVSSPHTAHITHLYASLASLSSSFASYYSGAQLSPPARHHLHYVGFSSFPSSSLLLGLHMIGHVLAFPDHVALLPDLVPILGVDASSSHPPPPPSSFSLFSYSSFSTIPVLLRAPAPGLSSSEFPSEISFI